MKIKSFLTGVFLCLTVETVVAAGANSLAIIPWPQQVTRESGVFKLTPDTRVYADSASGQTASFLAERLRLTHTKNIRMDCNHSRITTSKLTWLP